jgi:hypothetical protein
MKRRLVLESWFLLLRLEWIMRFRGFKELRRAVEAEGVHTCTSALPVPKEDLCRAMDYACVFYFKPVLCLQRSAATTVFLRRHGWSTEMVIGAQLLPFKSHAWCEINGVVVNDKPYVRDIYEVLERC